MPLSISEDFTISAGQRLLIENDQIGILLRHPHAAPVQPPPPTLTIRGEFAFRGSGTNGWWTAIQFDENSGGWGNSEIGNQTHTAIHITASGVVDVEGGRYIRGVYSPGYNGDFINEGRFEVRSIDPSGVAEGLGSPHGSSFDFTNSGTFRVVAPNQATGVVLAYGGNFVNSGLVEVIGGTFAVGLSTHGFTPASSFQNTGTLRAITTQSTGQAQSIALKAVLVGTGGEFIINNSGVIESAMWAIKCESSGSPVSRAREIVLNSGEIIGDIDLFLGYDEIINTGLIRGNVYLGGENDIYDGRDGELIGAVFGGDGADEIYGGTLGEVLGGDAGDDVIHGGGGDDRLEAGNGRDQLFGEEGDDVLFLFAGPDDDLVDGGAGYDIVELWAKRSDFKIVETVEGILLAGQWGTALLRNVEEISFSDETWAPGLIICPPLTETHAGAKASEALVLPAMDALAAIDPWDLATMMNGTTSTTGWIW